MLRLDKNDVQSSNLIGWAVFWYTAGKVRSICEILLFASRSLTDSKQMDFVRQTRDLIQRGQFNEAVSVDCRHVQTDSWIIFFILLYLSLHFFLQIRYCEDLIAQAMEGLSYYHTYDRLFLGGSVVLGFIGWTSYVVLFILKTHASLRKPPSNTHMVSKSCCILTCRSFIIVLIWRLVVYWYNIVCSKV